MIVVDASVLANAVGDDGDTGSRHRAVLGEAVGLAVPDLAYVETVAALRRRWLAGDLPLDRFEAAVVDLIDLPLDAYTTAPLLARVVELRDTLTAYDAVYVALAEALGCDLVTADRRLATASGVTCPVRVVG